MSVQTKIDVDELMRSGVFHYLGEVEGLISTGSGVTFSGTPPALEKLAALLQKQANMQRVENQLARERALRDACPVLEIIPEGGCG